MAHSTIELGGIAKALYEIDRAGTALNAIESCTANVDRELLDDLDVDFGELHRHLVISIGQAVNSIRQSLGIVEDF